MNEILNLLKEFLSPRVMINILLLIAAGFIFKTVHDYPIKELFFDKWFLVTAVVITTINIAQFILAAKPDPASSQTRSVAKYKHYLLPTLIVVAAILTYLIFTSSLADRTAEGKYGIYIARLDGDPDRKVHNYLTNALETALYNKSQSEDARIQVRDLKKSISKDEEDESNLRKEKQDLNATVIMWGSVTREGDKTILILRHWAGAKVIRHPLVRLDLTDNSYIDGVASSIWQSLAEAEQAKPDQASKDREEVLLAEINRLKDEIEALRQNVDGPNASGNPAQAAESGTAVLIGIADYPFAGGDLRGPLNDIAAMQNALKQRMPGLKFTTLKDQEATADRVKETVLSTARNLGQDEILIVHFSGHGTSIPNPSIKSNDDQKHLGCLAPYDVETNLIVVRDLATDVFKIHPKSVFLLDADNSGNSSLPAEVIKSGAVMAAAGINQHGFESDVGGKTMGAFTAALVQVLSSSSLARPASIRAIFSKVQLELRKKDQQPLLEEGRDAPWL